MLFSQSRIAATRIAAKRGDKLARTNYQYEKRRRDLAKKKKKEEKRQRKLNKNNTQPEEQPHQSPDGEEAVKV